MMNRRDGFSMRGVGGPGTKGGSAPATGRTSSTRKLVCPQCGQSVRATKTVNILCGDPSQTTLDPWEWFCGGMMRLEKRMGWVT